MAFPETFGKSTSVSATYPQVNSRHIGLFILLLLVVIGAGSIYFQNRLPAVVPATAPPSEFSAARALDQLRPISAQPHPIGSHAHTQVREYLVSELSKLGLSPFLQQSTAVNVKRAAPFTAGVVQNILVKIPGSANTRAVLLVSHYDSVPTSFGASDDGAGVVTLLETARALKAGPPLKNDVILLFTDGEEVGLLGAQAFVNENPWSKDVGFFVNFEARGNGGPVFMFETTNGNGNLIRQFGKTSPVPRASSFSREIYKLLSNDTDFTVLRAMDAQGMNFAFLGGINHYHTSLDRAEEIELPTLQQQGAHALALTQHFGNIDLTNIRANDVVYFDVIGQTLLTYSKTWIFPLLALTTALFAFVVARGIATDELRVKGILIGVAALVGGIIISAVACGLVWFLTQRFFRSVPWSEPYQSTPFQLGFILLTFAALSVVYLLLRNKANALSLMVGACVVWLLMSIATSVAIPGSSYLFTIPLLFTCLSLLFFFVSKVRRELRTHLLILFTGVPVIILWTPLVYNILTALTLNGIAMAVIFVVLPLGLLLPLIVHGVPSRRWLLPGSLAVVSLCLMLTGILVSGFDPTHPKTNNILYALNADTGKAIFASSDQATDEWTRQFLSNGIERGTLNEFFPGSKRVYMKSSTAAAELPAPQASLISDSRENGVRTLTLHLGSQRNAPVLSVYTQGDVEIVDAWIDGKQAMPAGQRSVPMRDWGIHFHGLPEKGVELVLKTNSEKPYRVLVVDRSYGIVELPGHAMAPRGPDMISSPHPASDASLVAKSFDF